MPDSDANAWSKTISGMPKVGQTASRTRMTSMRDIELFTEITGDRNPLHYDVEKAENSIFGKLIVQGGVTSGLLNAVVAEDLPGPGTVFLGMELKFSKAVGIDEKITAIVEVLDVRADKPICKLAVSVVDEAGERCLSGTAATYTASLA